MTSFKTTSQKVRWPALSSSSCYLHKEKEALSFDSSPNTVSFQWGERGKKGRGRAVDSCLTQVTSLSLRSVLPGSTLVLRFHSDLHVFEMVMGSLAVLSSPLQPVWTARSGGPGFGGELWRRQKPPQWPLGWCPASSAGLFCLTYQGVRKRVEEWVGCFAMLYPLRDLSCFPLGIRNKARRKQPGVEAHGVT